MNEIAKPSGFESLKSVRSDELLSMEYNGFDSSPVSTGTNNELVCIL